MAYVFNLPALGATPTTGGRVQIDIPDLTTETGWKSYWYLPTGSGTGSSTFIGLTDVPASFTGSGTYIVRVNGAETALEFVELSTLETDPVFTTWLSTTPPAYPGDIPSIVGLLDETAHDLLDHTGLTGIPAAQIQSDWNQTNNALLDYIKNKPTIPSTSGLLDETAHDLLDHTGLTGIHAQNTDTGTTSNTFTIDSDSSTGKIVIDVALNAGNDKTMTLTNEAMTSDITLTLPAITGTLALTSQIPSTSGYGDMLLSGIQSVTGLKTFDKDKVAMKGTSTGINTFSVANTSATSYTNTIPAKTGTFAMTDIVMFDATVGTGGDYATVYAAVAASKYTLKLLSNVTETQTFTLGASVALIIYLNNFNINFTNCAVNQPTNTTKVIFRGPGSITSTQTDTARVLLQGSNTDIFDCVVTNLSNQAGSALCTTGTNSFYNCAIILPNVANTGLGTNNHFNGSLINVNISGGGSNSTYTIMETTSNGGAISNVYISARGNVAFQSVAALHTGIYMTQANSSLIMTSEVKVTNALVAGSTRVDLNAMLVSFEINTISESNDGAIFTNGVVNGAVALVSKNSYKFTDVTFLSTLGITTDSHKFIGCKVTGTTTLNAGAEYNTLIGNTLTGAFTNNSGNATNIIFSNYGVANSLTDSYTLTNLAGSGDRIVQANSAGLLSASIPVITGKLSDSTAISLLVNTSNWDVDGAYTGTAITGTYEGQYYCNTEYYFTAYSDNTWIRLPRA
jgi:hypothetical protein